MNWDNVHNSREGARYPDTDVVKFMARNYYKTDRAQVKMLEIGFGTGANLWYGAREGFQVYGFDSSRVAFDKAMAMLTGAFGARFGLLEGDILELLTKHSSPFDCIIDIEAVYANELAIAKRIYSECYRVLKPGGRMLIKHFAEGTSAHLLDPTFIRFLSKAQVPDLVGRFNVDKCELHTRTQGAGIIKEWVIELIK